MSAIHKQLFSPKQQYEGRLPLAGTAGEGHEVIDAASAAIRTDAAMIYLYMRARHEYVDAAGWSKSQRLLLLNFEIGEELSALKTTSVYGLQT